MRGLKSFGAGLEFLSNENSYYEKLLKIRSTDIDLDFVKSFWNLIETTPARHGPKIIAPSVKTNCTLTLKLQPKLAGFCCSEPLDATATAPHAWLIGGIFYPEDKQKI